MIKNNQKKQIKKESVTKEKRKKNDLNKNKRYYVKIQTKLFFFIEKIVKKVISRIKKIIKKNLQKKHYKSLKKKI